MIMTLARKPLIKNLVTTIETSLCGAINIDGTRIPLLEGENTGVIPTKKEGGKGSGGWKNTSEYTGSMNDDWKKGRWGANFIISECAVAPLNRQGGVTSSAVRQPTNKPIYNTENASVVWNENNVMDTTVRGYSDKGFVSRYFKVVR